MFSPPSAGLTTLEVANVAAAVDSGLMMILLLPFFAGTEPYPNDPPL